MWLANQQLRFETCEIIHWKCLSILTLVPKILWNILNNVWCTALCMVHGTLYIITCGCTAWWKFSSANFTVISFDKSYCKKSFCVFCIIIMWQRFENFTNQSLQCVVVHGKIYYNVLIVVYMHEWEYLVICVEASCDRVFARIFN